MNPLALCSSFGIMQQISVADGSIWIHTWKDNLERLSTLNTTCPEQSFFHHKFTLVGLKSNPLALAENKYSD